MLDESYYQVADEIIGRLWKEALFSDSDHAGHTGSVSVSSR